MSARSVALAITVAMSVSLAPSPVCAWGATGHRLVSGAAIRALPADLPAFLRTPDAHDEVALLGPEADRVKGAGQPLDGDDDPAHYVDVSDDLSVGGVPLAALPRNRQAYDAALRAASSNQYAMGYLPYQIADEWERIVRDLAMWRVDLVGVRNGAPADRPFFDFERRVRETVVLRDIGYWGHFVGDGSQPLHASVHFNGWNSKGSDVYPNPKNYSSSHSIHARFETALVRAVASEDAVFARMTPLVRSDTPIMARVGAYLSATAAGVPAVYDLEAWGGIDARSPAATAFVLDRLAAGAAQMRDLIVAAWDASDAQRIGYPGVPVKSFESGAAVPTRELLGLGD